ncbi:hypothetical protein ES703_115589 [subsurface metagenome]
MPDKVKLPAIVVLPVEPLTLNLSEPISKLLDIETNESNQVLLSTSRFPEIKRSLDADNP